MTPMVVELLADRGLLYRRAIRAGAIRRSQYLPLIQTGEELLCAAARPHPYIIRMLSFAADATWRQVVECRVGTRRYTAAELRGPALQIMVMPGDEVSLRLVPAHRAKSTGVVIDEIVPDHEFWDRSPVVTPEPEAAPHVKVSATQALALLESGYDARDLADTLDAQGQRNDVWLQVATIASAEAWLRAAASQEALGGDALTRAPSQRARR